MREPSEVRRDLQEVAKLFAGMNFDNAGLRGAMIGHLNEACGSDGERHMLFKYLFGKLSSHDLTGGEWVALLRWMQVEKIDDAWVTSSAFREEAGRIVDAQCGLYREVYSFD